MMRCFNPTCDSRAPKNTLFRVNVKGRPGVWACNAHRLEPDAELDAIIDEIKRRRTAGEPVPHG